MRAIPTDMLMPRPILAEELSRWVLRVLQLMQVQSSLVTEVETDAVAVTDATAEVDATGEAVVVQLEQSHGIVFM